MVKVIKRKGKIDNCSLRLSKQIVPYFIRSPVIVSLLLFVYCNIKEEAETGE